MNSIGLSNVSGVLRVHNDLHLPEETSPERRREEEKQKRKQDRERRRLELEKKRDEKRREKEQRKNDMPAVQRLSEYWILNNTTPWFGEDTTLSTKGWSV